MTVYADVLVALNILLTYILVVATRAFCRVPTNRWAVLLSSVIGGICSLVIFYESGGVIFSVIYKMITASAIVAVAFLPATPKIFIKEFSAFFGISLLFGGGMVALEFTLHPKNIFFYNGTVYFDMSIACLVASVLVIYGAFLMGDYFIRRHNTKGGKCQLEIYYNDNRVTITAFIDTGNSLTDGMTGRPVIIAELSAVSPLFTREELIFFRSDSIENVPESLNKSFRLIPCKTVTGDSLLKGFMPDFVKVEDGKNSYINSFCTVALTEKELSQGDYRALLNSAIFENVKEEKSDEKLYSKNSKNKSPTVKKAGLEQCLLHKQSPDLTATLVKGRGGEADGGKCQGKP